MTVQMHRKENRPPISDGAGHKNEFEISVDPGANFTNLS